MPPASPPAPDRPPRRARKVPAIAVAGLLFLGVLLLVGVALYVQRGPIGARLAVAYLLDRGVPATIRVERLDPGGFTGSAVLGDPKDPDLTVTRVEVVFEPIPLLKSGLAAPRIRSIRLVEPKLKARWDGKKLTFGSLQRLVDDASRVPGTGLGPSVVVERGQARLATPAGPLVVDGDGQLASGRLMRLSARLHAADLRQGDLTAHVAGASVQATARGDLIVATAHLDLPRAVRAGAALSGLAADLSAQIPYARTPRFDGRFSLDGKLQAAAVAVGAQTLTAPRLTLSLAGAATGPLERLTLRGSGTGGLTASSFTAPGASLQRLDLAGRLVGVDIARVGAANRFSLDADLSGTAAGVTAAGLSAGPARLNARLAAIRGLVDPAGGNIAFVPAVTVSTPRTTASSVAVRDGAVELASARAVLDWRGAGWSLSGPLRTHARAGALSAPVLAGDLTLRAFSLALAGDAAIGSAAPRLDLTGSAKSQGGGLSPAAAKAFAAALPLIGTDPVGEAAIANAFKAARLDAPAFALRSSPTGLRVALPRPLQIVGADGARVTVSALSAAPVAVASGRGFQGGLAIHLAGARLPELDVQVPTYRAGLDRGGLTLAADTRLTAAFDGDSLHGLRLAAPARLTRVGGVITARLQDCAPLSLAAFGQAAMPLLTQVAARACPDPAQPVLVLGPRNWRFGALLRDFDAHAPAGDVDIRAGQGRLQMTANGGVPPTGRARIESGRVVDAVAVKRFGPLALTGGLDLARDVWTGPVQVAEAAHGRPLATVQVRHAMSTSRGSADIAAPALTFAKGGLQPGDLSPLAGTLAADAEGTVSFTGRAEWAPDAPVVSSGRLTTAGVDFRSQFGQVTKANATLDFDSLAPLTTAPGQPVAADAVAWLVPLSKASARIALKPDRMAIDLATAQVANGKVVMDPLDLLFVPNSPMSSVVRLTEIDLGALIKQFNLADKLTIDARIDGVVPFAFTNGALRLDKGHVFATGPGRLSVRREALTGASATVEAAPGVPAPTPPGGVQDIAYQALENLAFDKLEADIVSQPMGRLGILFKINGRNDPPNGGETRISLFDLLRGKAFDRPLTLPKGTPVNLTLDTSLNFDELLAAYTNRGRSEPVQPTPAKK